MIASYERFGANRLRVLAQEDRLPSIAEDAAAGRRMHHEWVRHIFASLIDGHPPGDQRRGVAARIALKDVYIWKVLRHGAGLSEADAHTVLIQCVSSFQADANA